MKVFCPYCNNEARLVDSAVIYRGISYGNIWLCKPCDAYVGTHKGTDNLPKGRLANRELRDCRKKAHLEFDAVWKSGAMSRGDAYRWLQNKMQLSPKEAHIGEFNVRQCIQLISLIKQDNPVKSHDNPHEPHQLLFCTYHRRQPRLAPQDT